MQRLSPVFLVEWKEIITFRLMQTCYAEWLKWKWFIITKHTFLIFQTYQTILNINFVSIIQDERLVLPVCMTTLIKLNFKEHESSDAQHIQCPRPHNRHDNCGAADGVNSDNDDDDNYDEGLDGKMRYIRSVGFSPTWQGVQSNANCAALLYEMSPPPPPSPLPSKP